MTVGERSDPKRDRGSLRHLWLSPWTGWVGLRYLRSKKNSRFLSFITILSILGVCIGVTAMIVVLSVMDGFEAELKKRLMSTDLHVLILPTPRAEGFDQGFVPKSSLDVAGIEQALMRHGIPVSSFSPVVSTEAILKSGRHVTGVSVKGVDAARLKRLNGQLTESADPEMLFQRQGPEMVRLPGIYVGQELAYEMGLMPGDPVTLISPTEREGPLSSVPRLKRYVVEGIYHSGLPEQELHTTYSSDQAVRAFLRKAGVVSRWEIALRDFNDAADAAEVIRTKAPQFKVRDWMQLNSHLFQSLRLERTAMFVILAFIIVVASFNIVTTLTLMVLEKKKEISILKAMGARNGQVAAVFLAEGMLIGGVGVGGGVFLGLICCIFLRKFPIIQLPDVFYDRTLPVTFDPRYYLGIASCAVIIVLAACLYPSRRAARLHPLEGIRFG